MCSLFSGCSAKHPVTPEEFTKTAEKLEFSVTDTTQSTTGSYKVESFLTATNSAAVFCYYVLFSDSQEAMAFYNSAKSGFSDYITSNIDSSAYNKCEGNGEDGFQILVRLEKTVVFANGGAGYKVFGEELVEALGYN